jgi:predicted Zn-dependent protease
MRIRKVLSALLALVLAAVLLPAVQAPARAQLFGVSEQQEIQIGREVERQLARKPGFVNDPALTQYVTGIGLKLAKVSERPTLPWTYHVLQDTQVNALAAPGGFIFVTRGLLRFVQSDSELAFVLGHETTHVAHRHAVELAQRDMELQFGAVLLTQLIFGGNMTAFQLAQIGRALLDAKYSREKEMEADHFGVIYAQRAGYDPTASLQFFERLQKQEKQQPSLLHAFEDHPDTPARIAALCTELTQMGYHVACPVPPAPAPVTSSAPPSPPRPTPRTPPSGDPGIGVFNR